MSTVRYLFGYNALYIHMIYCKYTFFRVILFLQGHSHGYIHNTYFLRFFTSFFKLYLYALENIAEDFIFASLYPANLHENKVLVNNEYFTVVADFFLRLIHQIHSLQFISDKMKMYPSTKL